MFPVILTVLNRDDTRGYFQGLLVEGEISQSMVAKSALGLGAYGPLLVRV